MNATHERDAGRCVVHAGCRATEVHHRIHGDRENMDPPNLLSVCRRAHNWIEHHFRAAQERGWTVSRHGQDPAQIVAWMEDGPYGQGWYGLDAENGYWCWPGSVRAPATPPPGEVNAG